MSNNPYNQTSEHYGNRMARDSQVDLSEDTNNLGGIPADEYARKKWVLEVFENYLKQCNIDINTVSSTLENTLKAYINASIETQATYNGTTYAKKTDLTALESKLRTELQKYSNDNLSSAKNYADSKVSDLNTTVNASLTSLNNYINAKFTELFQSVSNGKSKVAGAITDKGVSTSATATFDEMATNIRNIKTTIEGGNTGGDGSGSETGGVDLSIASPLIPDNISLGKIAYGSNGLIVGTHKCNYGSGGDSESGSENTGTGGSYYPTYGTDTSGTTAKASDILEGKTAYSNGVHLTGTLKLPVELHELDPINTLNDDVLIGLNSYIDEGEQIKQIVYNKNNSGVLVSTIGKDSNNKDCSYIYSLGIDNGHVVRFATAGENDETIYKKYKYSMADLGITYNNYGWNKQGENAPNIIVNTIIPSAFFKNSMGEDTTTAYLYIVTNLWDSTDDFQSHFFSMGNGISVVPYYADSKTGYRLGLIANENASEQLAHTHIVLDIDTFRSELKTKSGVTYDFKAVRIASTNYISPKEYSEYSSTEIDSTMPNYDSLQDFFAGEKISKHPISRNPLMYFRPLYGKPTLFFALLQTGKSITSSNSNGTYEGIGTKNRLVMLELIKTNNKYNFKIREDLSKFNINNMLYLTENNKFLNYYGGVAVFNTDGTYPALKYNNTNINLTSSNGSTLSATPVAINAEGTLLISNEIGSIYAHNITVDSEGVINVGTQITVVSREDVSLTTYPRDYVNRYNYIDFKNDMFVLLYIGWHGGTYTPYEGMFIMKTSSEKCTVIKSEYEFWNNYEINTGNNFRMMGTPANIYYNSKIEQYKMLYSYHNQNKSENLDKIITIDASPEVYALSYQGQKFIKQGILNLTATASDVVTGKKFIGSTGIVETGTKTEVIENE